MISQRLYIVTGSSKGLGLEICKNLIRTNSIVLGISKSESKICDANYHHLIHDFKNKININDITKLELHSKMEICIILNAAHRYDEEYNSNNFFNMFLTSFNVNFYNQFDFVNNLNQVKKIEKLLLISSYSIFTLGNKVRDIGYFLGKDNYRKIASMLKMHYKINCKCIIIGTMKTQLHEEPSTLSNFPFIGKYLEKKLSLTSNDVAINIIENLESKKNIILIPNIPIFLIKLIVWIIEIIGVKK
jgi:hypothetical protein